MHFDDGLVDGLELPSGSSESRPLIVCRTAAAGRCCADGSEARALPIRSR